MRWSKFGVAADVMIPIPDQFRHTRRRANGDQLREDNQAWGESADRHILVHAYLLHRYGRHVVGSSDSTSWIVSIFIDDFVIARFAIGAGSPCRRASYFWLVTEASPRIHFRLRLLRISSSRGGS